MKDSVHRFSDREELKALDHALRFVLSESHDDDAEQSLRLLDARIDAAQSRGVGHYGRSSGRHTGMAQPGDRTGV